MYKGLTITGDNWFLIELSAIERFHCSEMAGAPKALSGHVAFKRTFNGIHIFHYVLIQQVEVTINRKILMLHTTFTLAIFLLIL